MKKLLIFLAITFIASHAHAAKWQWKWTPAPGEVAPRVEVAPLKYGKSWAYSFEIDDGPSSSLTVSQPLLARYHWNDAPLGVVGGTIRPFVGTAAVVLGGIGVGKSTNLSFEQIAELRKNGWSIVNHSYWHTGNHWDKTKFLKPEDFARELFWSQTVYAELLGDGRAASHFVFPNGDYHYGPHLAAFGLQSATRVGGSSPRNLFAPKLNFLDFSRNYLDEGVWAKQNNALAGFPDKPAAGDFIIDFTHGMDADAESANNKRWVERLNHIASTFGADGDNSMWVAPSDEVVNYALAAKAAKVAASAGGVAVDVPDALPGSALTLKISGLSTPALAALPKDATVYRQGDTVWLTTPVIGVLGAPPLAPRVRRIYAGEIKDLKWDKPVKIAGVRIRQAGGGGKDFVLKIDAIKNDGKIESLLSGGETKLTPLWGVWNLYCVVPDRPAIEATALHVTPDRDLKEMEVWAVEK